jgi:hypothetical protein
MKLNEKEIIIKTNKEVLQYFMKYIQTYRQNESVFIQGYFNEVSTTKHFESLMNYNLNTILEKISNCLYNNLHNPINTPCKFKVNKAERVCLSVLFKRIEIPIILSSIELTIINKLIF